MNIELNKIRSYQTLVYKNGYRTFKKKEYEDYRLEIISQLDKTINIDSNDKLKINLDFYFKVPKSASKIKKDNLLKNQWCDKKIDLDNITKPILDIVSEYYGFDDKNVVLLITLKKWAENEHINIEIDKLI